MARTLREVIGLSEFETPELKKKYDRMADLFEMMLPMSLEQDQFGLVEVAGEGEFGHPDWNEFLALPPVNTWIESQVYGIVKARSRKAQSNMGSNDAKTLLSIVEKREGDDLKRVVVMRIPDKYADK